MRQSVYMFVLETDTGKEIYCIHRSYIKYKVSTQYIFVDLLTNLPINITVITANLTVLSLCFVV